MTDLRGQHDLGGLPAGPVDTADHDVPPFGKLLTAVFSALRQHDVVTVDEVRRALEDLPTEVYDQDYYERWGEAMTNLLEEKGVLTRAEVEGRMSVLKEKLETKKMSVEQTSQRLYQPGDRVTILNSNPPGHRRVPVYIRGKSGEIERYCGAFRNPEELAYGFDGLPKRHLYRVRFRQHDVWENYEGPEADTIDLEIYEHWLLPETAG